MGSPEPAAPRVGVTPIDQSAALTRRITTLSVAVSTVLTLAKLVAWLGGGSVALLASLADSALDVVAATATYVAVRVAVSPPDEDHRFGHGKAEAFASLLQAGLVFASAALIAREAPHVNVSLSSDVAPQIREYYRLSTTVVNAYLNPKLEHYIQSLDERLSAEGCERKQRYIMRSNGGVATFAGCDIDVAGTGYKLTATDGILTSSTTAGT